MPDPETARPVLEHYGTGDLTAQVGAALRRAGLEHGPVAWPELAPLDQFHIRGLAATRELAQELKVPPGATVLDAGCGLGGPARHLAAEYSARVTGIDLSQPYVDVARMLTERCGLADRAAFRQADALDLPFADASFDHAWTQHVAMNIADRDRFYRSLRRVLKPGGRLAIYDIVAGEAGPVHFPVPWARGPEISHLLSAGTMAEALREAGFRSLAGADRTAAGQAWFRAQAARAPAPPPALGLQVVMGPEFPAMFANLGRNLAEGRIRLVQAILVSA